MNATQSVGKEPTPPGKLQRLSKTGLKVVGGITALVVTLAIVGAIWVPKLIHQTQVNEYGHVIAATDQAMQQKAQNKASEEAALQLQELQDAAARDYGVKLTALGATESPILVAETVAIIKKDADKLTKSLGEAPDPVPGAEDLPLQAAYTKQVAADKELFDKSVAAIEAQKTKDLEAAKDDASKSNININEAAAAAVEDACAQQITANQLDLTVPQAVELLELDSSAVPITPVPADQVNGEVLTQAKQDRDNAVAAADEQAQTLETMQQRLNSVQGKVDASSVSVRLAALEAPTQANAVLAAAPRAAADKQTESTTAAQTANETLHDAEVAPAENTPEHSASEALNLVNAYVAAAKGVMDHHAAVLAEEAAVAAAAEAAAAGASGYTDPNTGGWVDTDWSGGGGSSGWSGGGGSSGWSGGDSGGGGGSSGGGGNDSGGGGTPASWFEANCQWGYNWSSSGGGTGYCYPAPDLDDDW